MDLDAGRTAAVDGEVPRRSPLSQRVREALAGALSLPAALSPGGRTANDPVATLARTHRTVHSRADTATLRRAYTVAEKMHDGQMRKSGEPYITHPLAVAQILAELGMDTTTLVAALLHDTVEDTSYTLPALHADFGPLVAHLVDGVTKFDKVFYGTQAEAETIRKMIIAAGKDVRVLVIKIADRLHNMRTLGARSPASRTRIARATQDVLVPLCDRLGIQMLKRDLEDAVLRHLDPEAFAEIDRFVRNRVQWWAYLGQVTAQARAMLRRVRIDATVEPRPRHYYSIWKDTVAGDYTQPFDLPRIVVVVDGPETDCYAALGTIHGSWCPLAGRFKDFIGAPKNNLYRSLHTTVIGPGDRTVEVLIRTEAMHRAAEYGIAANFRYPKEVGADSAHAEQLAWLHRVLRWEQDAPDPDQFIESLRSDLADNMIQVIAEGRAMVLPAGSTPVDVAYELATAVGNRCRAAKINSRVMPLTTPLSEGDLVEIITAPDDEATEPREEWLSAVRSPTARAQLRRWFASPDDEPALALPRKIRKGRAALAERLRHHDRGLPQERPLCDVAEQLGFPDPDALLVGIVDERVTADEVARCLLALVDRSPAGYGD